MVQSHIQPNPCHPLTILYNAKHCCHQRFLLYSSIHFGGLARRRWGWLQLCGPTGPLTAQLVYTGIGVAQYYGNEASFQWCTCSEILVGRVDCVVKEETRIYWTSVVDWTWAMAIGAIQSTTERIHGSQRTDPRLVYTGCSAERGQYNQFTRPATVSPYLGFWDIFFECCVTPFSYNAAIGIILCGSCFK